MAFVPVKQVGQYGVNRDLSSSELARNWAKRVVLGFCFAIRFVSILRSIKQSQVNLLLIHSNASPPFLPKFVPAYPHKTARVICWERFVLMVFGVSAKAKVCKSVIRRVTVNVVNVLGWKFAVNVCPSKSVRLIFLVKNSYLNSTGSHQFVISTPNQPSLSIDLPSKKTSLWLVMKNLTKTLNVNAIFHAQFPLIEKTRVMVLGNWHGNQLSGATLAKQGAF